MFQSKILDNPADQRAVSVLLPVFLRETGIEKIDLLARAIDSVHDQTFPSDYEILVIDDGSATPILSFSSLLGADRLHKLRFIRLFRNSGLVHALNRGLTEAMYPWIARIDADDCWRRGKIEKQFALLARDADITIAATGMTRLDPSGNKIDEHVRPGDWHGILNFFVEVGCPFPHGSVLARRDIYRLLGGYPHNPDFSHCEDFALWGIWLRFFKPAMVEESLYDYTVSDGSVTGLHGEQQLRASNTVRKTFDDLGITDRLPELLCILADILNCTIVDAGILAYKMWRFNIVVDLPEAALSVLESMMPDRRMTIEKGSISGLSIDNVIRRRLASDRSAVLVTTKMI